jgi:hypothetical protein
VVPGRRCQVRGAVTVASGVSPKLIVMVWLLDLARALPLRVQVVTGAGHTIGIDGRASATFAEAAADEPARRNGPAEADARVHRTAIPGAGESGEAMVTAFLLPQTCPRPAG